MDTRADWVALADRLLASARRHASPGHARIVLPGPPGGYGRDVDGLEGFARTFLLAGFRIAGEQGQGQDHLVEAYARGLANGTDPRSPERWVRLDQHGQAKVEAASIALILDLTRPWLWDRLPPHVRDRVIAYLAPAVGDATYPPINWVWFRLVVQTFLRSVGGPHSTAEMRADLATHDSFARAGGWRSDGADRRAYDHYAGWALHLYPVLWARMAGADDLAAPRRVADVAALDAYLHDALALIGGDGSPLLQGRSLIYRFAAAAPFWAGALAGVPSHKPGTLRHAATRIVDHFASRGAPDERGLLTMGWHGQWPRMAQSYSGPGSPYWAAKGFLGLVLPADHPAWAEAAEPLPVAEGDVLRAVTAPGWIVSGTRADGIVRVVNHGTDHAHAGYRGADSPWYARLGYSTATSPVLAEAGWGSPLDQSVVVVGEKGETSHRTGFRTVTVRLDTGGGDRADPVVVGVAASTWLAHWADTEAGAPDHGDGRPGRLRPAGTVTVVSLVRGPWEIRLARTDAARPLRIGGWPVTGDLTSTVRPLLGIGTPGEEIYNDAGPLGTPTRVPYLHFDTATDWVAAVIELSGPAATSPPPSFAVDEVAVGPDHVEVRWPDGRRTRHHFAFEEQP